MPMITKVSPPLSIGQTLPRPPLKRRWTGSVKFLAGLTISSLTVAALWHPLFLKNDGAPGDPPVEKLYLSSYRLSQPPIELDHKIINASGLTFNAERGILLLIQNAPTRILELSREGQVLRSIDLKGFEDTEDIVHLGGSRYAVIEERRRSLALINITAETTSVDHADVRSYLVEPEETGNKGLEGLTYNPSTGEYFAVREKKPRKIYRFSLSDRPGPVNSASPWNAQWHSNDLSDLSAIHMDSSSGRLLLLSDESKALIEVDHQGKELGRLQLLGGHGELSRDIPQPEGVTMDERKTLYICSEPNLLYIYSPAGG